MENLNSKNNDHLKLGGRTALTHMGFDMFASLFRSREFVYNATVFIAITSYTSFLSVFI